MRFFDRMSNGWQLAKTSLQIINQEKSLLLFPVLSTLALIMVVATFFGGGYFLFGEQILAAEEVVGDLNPLAYVLAFCYYFVTYFVVIFFNSALVHCAVKILNGESTNISDGLQFAVSRMNKILMWTGIAATVGLLLRVLQSNDKIGQIAAAILGTGWSILTFFVVPVLLYEDKNAFQAIKQSGSIMRQKWGESLGANFGFGLINFLGILAIGLLAFGLSLLHPILGIITGVTLVVILITVMAAAETIFVAAVYQRVNQLPTGQFDDGLLDSSFRNK